MSFSSHSSYSSSLEKNRTFTRANFVTIVPHHALQRITRKDILHIFYSSTFTKQLLFVEKKNPPRSRKDTLLSPLLKKGKHEEGVAAEEGKAKDKTRSRERWEKARRKGRVNEGERRLEESSGGGGRGRGGRGGIETGSRSLDG